MNDIFKENTTKKFEEAFRKEHLSKAEAGSCIGLAPNEVSYLFNKNYWDKLSPGKWGKVQAWVSSGYSLKEYPNHHPEAVKKKVKYIIPSVPKEERANIDREVKEAMISPLAHSVQMKYVKVEEKLLGTPLLIDLLKEQKDQIEAELKAIDYLISVYQ